MTGSLQKKGNTYYAVVRIPDGAGKTKQKWVSTGVKITGNNKREANRRLQEIVAEMEEQVRSSADHSDMLFLDWIEVWLEQKKNEVREISWQLYRHNVNLHIVPFFAPLELKLAEVGPQHIQDFYNLKLKSGLSSSSVRWFGRILNGPLKAAYRKGLIAGNPADRVTRPPNAHFEGKAYTPKQARKLLEVISGRSIEAVVKLALFYGLRRSEVLGLRWRDVDFDTNTILICNTIVQYRGKIVEQEITKTQASRRTLHMPADVKAYLQGLKRTQDKRRREMGEAYHPGDYVCTSEDGSPFPPSYITAQFPLILKQAGLPIIRFHDLRHTAASMLMEKGIMLMQVSKFLGHKKIATTVDIYGHLSAEGKKETAKAMGSLITLQSG